MKEAVEAIKHWRTALAALAAVLVILSKLPDISKEDVENLFLALGVFFAADARASKTNG